jgi:acyl carrier protein
MQNMNINELTQLIIDTTRDVAAEQSLELTEELSPETRLFGANGLLDSLALVALVIAVEQAIEDKFAMVIELADDKALSQKNSPYRTIGSLATYATQQGEARRANA